MAVGSSLESSELITQNLMSDIHTILEVLLLIGMSVTLLLLRLLRSYATKKGENLATKEDIGDITREVEEVRREYSERFENLAQQNRLLLESVKQHHELRLAAIDRRLAAHQEAYALWWKLLGSVHKEHEVGTVVMECQEWWVHNRLYLEPEVAQAFSLAYHAARSHAEYSQERPGGPAIQENWNKISSVGEIIVKAVQLPCLKEGEYQPLEASESGKINEREKPDA